MDYSKLKGRPPYPFETIGVALAFSPRLEGVLGEGKRLAAAVGARLLLLHIGERTAEKEEALGEILGRLGMDAPDIPVIWREGEPVVCLRELCKANAVDLLILGARRRENMLRYYLGSVARSLSRSAKCSLLLLTDPKAGGSPFRKMVVSGVDNPKTIHTLRTALYFGQQVGATDITVVRELDQPGLAMATAGDSIAGEASSIKKQFRIDEADKVHAMVRLCSPGGIAIAEKVIPGRPGHAIRDYAEESGADLLVINSPDGQYGLIDRIFTHDMEYILEELPCSMLIVHSRAT